MTEGSIPAGARIGHVHLMGFDLLMRQGDEAAFLSAGGYHHHIGLASDARGTAN
jgi:catechol 2,3-dioxygenase